jgi:hypothetical protein
MVGRAQGAEATLAGLKSLRRWGRLVLMGNMIVPLPLTYAESLQKAAILSTGLKAGNSLTINEASGASFVCAGASGFKTRILIQEADNQR